MSRSQLFKTEIIITVIVIIAIGFMASILYQAYTDNTPEITIEPTPTPAETTPTPTPTQPPATPQPTTTPTTTQVLTDDTIKNFCENCHLTGKPTVPQARALHDNLAKYCLRCHTIDHNTHPMTEDGVECSRCHGTKAPTVPTDEESTKTCGSCHNYPDPLTPSNGNLITVHRPRDVGCPDCHGNNVMDIHLTGKNVRIEDMLQQEELLNRLGKT